MAKPLPKTGILCGEIWPFLLDCLQLALTFQVGDDNTQNIDYSGYENGLEELKNEITSLKLTDAQAKALDDLISKAENRCKKKNFGIVKQALKEMWNFAKQTGSNLLVAYLTVKFWLGA